MSAVEAMSPVDRAWLEMDDPHNPMVVSAVMELRHVSDTEGLARRIVEGLLGYRRFTQRIDATRQPPVWSSESELLLPYHVRIFHLNEGDPEHDVAHAVARELSHPLDRALPLWRITLFVRAGGVVTVLFRAHHALADGIALLGVLLNCTDAPRGSRKHRARRSDVIDRALRRLGVAVARLRDLQHLVADDLRHPEHVLEQLRMGRDTIAAVGRVLALPDDNPAHLRRPLSGQRAVAWTDSLRFAPVRARARRLGVKINDIYLAALAGAFGRYLRSVDGPLEREQNLRVSIPVNLRAEDDGELGNHFGLVLLDLPVGIVDWRERLQLVAGRMCQLKESPEARAMLVSLAVAGHLPVPMEKRLVRLLAGKAAAVVSNLPGPRHSLRIAGMRIDKVVFWPPQAGGIGIGVSLFSYAGRVSVGVSADHALIADPQRLIADFEQELELIMHPRRHVPHSAETAAAVRKRQRARAPRRARGSAA